MEAKERARFVPKWSPAPHGAPGPILEVFRVDFWRLLDPLGHPLGRFWETFLTSFLLSRRAMWVTWGSRSKKMNRLKGNSTRDLNETRFPFPSRPGLWNHSFSASEALWGAPGASWNAWCDFMWFFIDLWCQNGGKMIQNRGKIDLKSMKNVSLRRLRMRACF